MKMKTNEPTKGYETKTLETYKDNLFGIPVVIKNTAIEYTEIETGDIFIEIPNEDQLQLAMAVARISHPVELTSADLKFLRKTCDMNSKSFSEYLKFNQSTYCRWEKSADGMGVDSERTVRAKVFLKLRGKAPALDVSLEDIYMLEVYGLLPDQEMAPMEFEMVRLKIDHQKTDEWDTIPIAA